RQPCLEEGEAGLHEHDEHGRDDDPKGVCSDQQLVVSHPRRSPVRWWTTSATGDAQQSPSPEAWPVLGAAAVAATTPTASGAATTNGGRGCGRKRDSNGGPRYSCVAPRSRPCPMASTTVTPTWPVSSSTASITVSTRSLTTTASTLTTSTSRT